MNVGVIGLGKLGFPCAVAITLKGHKVFGFDVDESKMTYDKRPYKETDPTGNQDFNEWLKTQVDLDSRLVFGDLKTVVRNSDIIFICVQTPHEEKYDGTHRLDYKPQDFDYTRLIDAIKSVSKVIDKKTPVGIISTVLPGTVRKHILPICHEHMRIFYNPSFIAMGTTMRDFLHPEFVLLGIEDRDTKFIINRFWSTVTPGTLQYIISIESAELTKMAYNTFISMKIAFANTLMEVCTHIPNANVNHVVDGLSLATTRVISPKYMKGGMGDGGGCHPRDNIALSWLSKKLGLSYDWFECTMLARERQTEWLANLMCSYPLPKKILGYTYKVETNITTGSPALLLESILLERGMTIKKYDPYVDGDVLPAEFENVPSVYLIGMNHPHFPDINFPEGSVVIDPWRYMPDKDGVLVVRLGE